MQKYYKQLRKSLKKSDSKQILGLLIILISLPVAVYLVQQTALYFSRAQVAPTADVYFTPNDAVLPPNLPVEITVNSGSSEIAFVRASIKFDNSKLNVVTANPTDPFSEVSFDVNPIFSNVAYTTDVSEANSTGKLVIAAGVGSAPEPSGVFRLATFNLSSISSVPNDSTLVAYEITDMQIVDKAGKEVSLSVSDATYSLNALSISATTTPTTGPGLSATVSPTNTYTPTPTSPFSISATVTATNSPTPTSGPILSATVSPTNTATLTPTSPFSISATISPTCSPIGGDANNDCKVNLLDYSILFAAFGTIPGDGD